MRVPKPGETGDLTLKGIKVLDVQPASPAEGRPHPFLIFVLELETGGFETFRVELTSQIAWLVTGRPDSWPPREGQLWRDGNDCRRVAIVFQPDEDDPDWEQISVGIDQHGGRVILLPVDGASLELGCDDYRPDQVWADHGPLELVNDFGPDPFDEQLAERRDPTP